MKPIQNFRDHPALKHESHQSIFAIEQKLYLYNEECVRRIFALKIQRTNIGEPFCELARFIFVIGEDEDSIDLDVDDVPNLVAMCNAIGRDLPVSKEFEKLL